MAKILRKSQDKISKIKWFCWPKKSILRHYWAYKIKKEDVTYFSQFVSVQVKKF